MDLSRRLLVYCDKLYKIDFVARAKACGGTMFGGRVSLYSGITRFCTLILCFFLLCADVEAGEKPFFFELHSLVMKMQDRVLYSRRVYRREVLNLLYSHKDTRIETGFDYISFSPMDLDRQYRSVICYSNWLLIRIYDFEEGEAFVPDRFSLYAISGILSAYRVDPDERFPVIIYLHKAKVKKLEEK